MKRHLLALSLLALSLGACTPNITPSSSIFSESSSSTQEEAGKYSVSFKESAGVFVSLKKERYNEGETVRFSISLSDPDQVVERLEPASLCFEEQEGEYSFQMPAKDVSIEVRTRYTKGNMGSLVRLVNKGAVAEGLSLSEGTTFELGKEIDFSFSSKVSIDQLYASWNENPLELKEENGKIHAKIIPNSFEGTLFIAENSLISSESGLHVTLLEHDEGAMVFGFDSKKTYSTLGAFLYRRPGYQISSFKYKVEGDSSWYDLPYDALEGERDLFSWSLYGLKGDVSLSLKTEKTGLKAIRFLNDEHVEIGNRISYSTPGDEVSFPLIQGTEGYSILDYSLEGLPEGTYSKSLSSLSFTMPSNPVTISFEVQKNGGIHIESDPLVTGYRLLNSIDLSVAEEINNASAGSTFFAIVYAADGYLPLQATLNGTPYLAKILEATGDRYFEFKMPEDGSDATIRIQMQTAYAIKVVNEDPLGNVRLVQEKAAKNELVSFVVFPKSRYSKLVSVTCLEEPTLKIAFDQSMGAFVMPDHEVALFPKFEAYPTLSLRVSLPSDGKITDFKVVGELSLIEMNKTSPSGVYIEGERLSISVDLPDSAYDATLILKGSYGEKHYSSTYREGEMVAFDYLTLLEGTEEIAFETKAINALKVTIHNEVGAKLLYKVNNKEVASLEDAIHLGDNFYVSVSNQYENGLIYSIAVTDDASGEALSIQYTQEGTSYFESYKPKGDFTITITAVKGVSVSAALNGYRGSVSISPANKPSEDVLGTYVLPGTELSLSIAGYGTENCDYSLSVGGKVLSSGSVNKYSMKTYDFVASGEVVLTVTPTK